jgi:hypothetical protein
MSNLAFSQSDERQEHISTRSEVGQSALNANTAKIFLDNLSNSGLAIHRHREGGTTSPAEDHFRRRQCRDA